MHAHALAPHAQALAAANALEEPLDAMREDHGVLMGEPIRTMTLHYKALQCVNGSLIADDANSEMRWIQKVLKSVSIIAF
jgi:hypothetical protein